MWSKYIALIVSYVGCVNCKHEKGWENKKGKIKCVGINLIGKYIWIIKERNVCLYLKDAYVLWCCNLEYMNMYVDF